MSPRPKLCSGSEAVKKVVKAGWTIDRQKGSHVMLTKGDFPYTLSIPQHREFGVGILSKLIKQSGVSVDEFNGL